MTYTFKLARRLAVSRTFGMLPAIFLFVACSGDDATAPGSDSLGPRAVPVTVSVHPNRVTVEANQLIRFLGHGRNSSGDTVSAPITWQATGGTILPDGRFSSAAVGTFMVMARTPVRGELMGRTRYRLEERVDTSMVTVVPRHPNLGSIEIAPDTATLAAGVSQSFLVTGRLTDGRAVPVGVTWNAAGGTIDAGGNFVAGDTAGTYRVIATHTTFTFADTARVTIIAPPLPEPAPVLEKVTLVPASATLAPAAARQFTAYGRTITGDSVSVSVAFAATGGTVTEGGLYTAGSTAGTYRIIATSGTLADTSSLTVTRPLGGGPAAGIPFGPYAAWDGTTLKANTGSFTATIGAITASNITAQIAEARSKKVRLILAMTGGAHENYLSVTNGVLQFDLAKWKARMDSYNTPAIKAAVAEAVADGTIIGNNVMDEPNVSGGGDGNTWGPAGTMTKVRVDGLCAYVKSMFPTLPVGAAHGHSSFEPDKAYRTCEFFIDQYHTRKGEITAWRDAGLAIARRDGHGMAFSLNSLSGGIQAKRDGRWDCPAGTTGGRGTYDPNCRMTPQQIRDFARVLGPHGCALVMWRYDTRMMADPEYQQAFRDVAAMLAAAPASPCRRS